MAQVTIGELPNPEPEQFGFTLSTKKAEYVLTASTEAYVEEWREAISASKKKYVKVPPAIAARPANVGGRIIGTAVLAGCARKPARGTPLCNTLSLRRYLRSIMA